MKADRVFAIHNLEAREAVMVEPTACALHGTEVLDAKPGSDVLLFRGRTHRASAWRNWSNSTGPLALS
mgnify:CR=1 FL=1